MRDQRPPKTEPTRPDVEHVREALREHDERTEQKLPDSDREAADSGQDEQPNEGGRA